MGILITFEGCEGCGKSYQIERLHQRLSQDGYPIYRTHEPGGTELGDKIRNIVKNGTDLNIVYRAEMFLFLAARAQLVERKILPELDSGHVVLCDRYMHSTFAYQGYGRGFDVPLLLMMNDVAISMVNPDLVVLLDIDPSDGLLRKDLVAEDRFESAGIDFHHRIRYGYLELVKAAPNRWIVIDGSKSRLAIEEEIYSEVIRRLTVDWKGRCVSQNSGD